MNDEKIEIEYVDPDTLKPDPNNPRTHFDEDFIKQLAESYKIQGIIEPVEVDENSMIRRGHQRVLACRIAGIKVPIRRKNGLSPEQWFERQLVDDSLRKDLDVIDRMWAYVAGIASINQKKFYSVEKIKELNKNDRKKLLTVVTLGDGAGRGDKIGQNELSRRIGIDQRTIGVYIKLFEHPESWEAVKSGKTGITFIREADLITDETMRKETLKAVSIGGMKKREQIETLAKISKFDDIKNLPNADKKAIVERAKNLEPEQIKIIPEVIKKAGESERPREIIESVISPTSRVSPKVIEKVLDLPKETHKQIITTLETMPSVDEQQKVMSSIDLEKKQMDEVEELRLQADKDKKIWTPEKTEALGTAYKKAKEELEARRKNPEWQKHTKIVNAINALTHVDQEALYCPVCGKTENVGWLCHNIPLSKSGDLYEKQRQEQVKKIRGIEEKVSKAVKKVEEKKK